jgi:hypothetical protein
VDVGICFEAIGASRWVLIATFFPVIVLSTVRAFLLILAEPRDVAEAEAFKASGNYDKVFNLAHGKCDQLYKICKYPVLYLDGKAGLKQINANKIKCHFLQETQRVHTWDR